MTNKSALLNNELQCLMIFIKCPGKGVVTIRLANMKMTNILCSTFFNLIIEAQGNNIFIMFFNQITFIKLLCKTMSF